MRFNTTSFLALCLTLIGTSLYGQVTPRQLMMSRGNQEALILQLPGSDPKLVEDLWEDWLKDTYRVKTSKTKKIRTGELSSLNFELPGVSNGGKVDMYSLISSAGEGSELTIWIATPQGYVGPDLDPTQYVEAEKMLMRFALEVSREQMEQDVENQEDQLSDLEKDLDRLRHDKERAEKEIMDARERIARLEADILDNIKNQETKRLEIQDQIQVVELAKRRLKDF